MMIMEVVVVMVMVEGGFWGKIWRLRVYLLKYSAGGRYHGKGHMSV